MRMLCYVKVKARSKLVHWNVRKIVPGICDYWRICMENILKKPHWWAEMWRESLVKIRQVKHLAEVLYCWKEGNKRGQIRPIGARSRKEHIAIS